MLNLANVITAFRHDSNTPRMGGGRLQPDAAYLLHVICTKHNTYAHGEVI